MTKITNIDRNALKALREPIEAELVALGERLGLKFELGNGKYGAGAEASFQLKITVDDPAVTEAADRAKWDANCHYIGKNYSAPNPEQTGLRPEDFGTEFTANRTRYRTVGLALKRSKFPILVEVIDGPKKGQRVCFGDMAVPTIRAATDAAKVSA